VRRVWIQGREGDAHEEDGGGATGGRAALGVCCFWGSRPCQDGSVGDNKRETYFSAVRVR
jgi:hypothetical protein